MAGGGCTLAAHQARVGRQLLARLVELGIAFAEEEIDEVGQSGRDFELRPGPFQQFRCLRPAPLRDQQTGVHVIQGRGGAASPPHVLDHAGRVGRLAGIHQDVAESPKQIDLAGSAKRLDPFPEAGDGFRLLAGVNLQRSTSLIESQVLWIEPKALV